MSLETSEKILKITGILSIIGGIVGIIFAALGIFGISGGGLLGPESTEEETAVGLAVIGGAVAVIVTALVELLEGFFSVRAANDHSKIMPAWIFAILGLLSGIGSVITGITGGDSLIGGIVSLVISIIIFMAANTIKNEG